MTVVEEELVFEPSSYDLPVPQQDGYRADAIRVRFTGVIDLDRTSLDDLDFVNALRFGERVKLIVGGTPDTKTFKHNLVRGDEGKVDYSVSVKLDELEIGEAA
jgi:hypothetical protein